MRSRLRRLLVTLVLMWAVAALVLVALAARAVEGGMDGTATARDRLAPEHLRDGSAETAFADASDSFRSGAAHLRHPVVAPLRWLPIVGRQLRAVATLAVAAGDVTEIGHDGARAARLAIDDDGPPDRVQTVEKLQGVLRDVRVRLEQVDPGKGEALVAPVGARHAKFSKDLEEALVSARRAERSVAALADVLGGRRYLVLVANNAEMRAGSGMFLSIGVLESVDGALQLGELESSGDLGLEGEGVPIDGDFAARWGWLHPNREWRNLGTSPRFDQTAALAARMWTARTGEVVDGVMALDVEAVRAVLSVTGPIGVDGEEFAAEGITDYLLHEQYLEFDVQFGDAQTDRRDRLGEIARGAVRALEGDVDVVQLGLALSEAARGRHVILWSRDAEVQAGWEAAGVAGIVDADSMLLAVLNRGANKLDRFLRTEAVLSTRDEGDRTEVEVQLTITNTTPEGEPPYVAGPYPGIDTVAGEYLGLAALTLPGSASEATLEGVPALSVVGSDGPTSVIGGEVRVPRGEERVVTWRFSVPAESSGVLLHPSARIPATVWHHDGAEFTDEFGRRLRW